MKKHYTKFPFSSKLLKKNLIMKESLVLGDFGFFLGDWGGLI